MEPVETPVESVTASVYVIPTDSPESDGTLAWDSTTMIVVTAVAAGVTGLGWTYGSPAVGKVIAEHLAPVEVRRDVASSRCCSTARSTRLAAR